MRTRTGLLPAVKRRLGILADGAQHQPGACFREEHGNRQRERQRRIGQRRLLEQHAPDARQVGEIGDRQCLERGELNDGRLYLSPCFVTQPIHKRLEPTSELVSPIRRPANHGRPLQKADHP